MATLTSHERLLRAIRHEEVDRVPVSPRYYDYLSGVKGCSCLHHCLWMARQYPHDPMIECLPPQNNYLLRHFGAYNDLPGVTVEMTVGPAGEGIEVHRRFRTPAGDLTESRRITRPGDPVGFDHIVEPLVKDRSDAEKIPFLLPSPEDTYIGDIPLLLEMVGERGVLTVRATQGVDQFLMDALGVQQALMMYYDDRELLKQLLTIFQRYHRAILKRILEQGVEVVFEPWYNCSLSVGWSPAQIREMFLPLIRDNVELIHSYGAYVDYFDDGKMDLVLEDLAGIGVDIVETLAPAPLGDVDLASAKRRIGDRVCLKGHIDQVNLICFGTPEEIREAVRRAMEVAAPGSGFILGTADSIRPESPPENVQAYFDAAREFGNCRALGTR